MHPRISETRSVLRNVPAGFRRPPRGTFVVAAATAATALVTVATVASASASTPATHHAAQAAAGTVAASSAAPAQTRHVTGHPAQAHPAQAHPGRGAHLTVRVARKAGHKAAPRALARPARPYRMYDSVTPSSIPAHQAAAVYSTGSYATAPGQVRHLGHALWIDTTGHNYSASVLDVEPGDATPAQAASWAFHRLQAHPHSLARIYTMISQWPAAQAAVRGLPGWMQSHVRWWIADPTGVPHIVPGASATQWYWGSSYDLSMVKPGF